MYALFGGEPACSEGGEGVGGGRGVQSDRDGISVVSCAAAAQCGWIVLKRPLFKNISVG